MAEFSGLIGTSVSEQLFFDGAQVSHIVDYYEHLRVRRMSDYRKRHAPVFPFGKF